MAFPSLKEQTYSEHNAGRVVCEVELGAPPMLINFGGILQGEMDVACGGGGGSMSEEIQEVLRWSGKQDLHLNHWNLQVRSWICNLPIYP